MTKRTFVVGAIFIALALLSVVCGDPLTFAVIGDWGGQSEAPFYTELQRNVSRALAGRVKHEGAKFIISLGDNFYSEGVTKETSHRFEETFNEIYDNSVLQKKWYIIAGEHDHMGSIQLLSDFSQKSERWNYPSNYYDLEFKIPDSHTKVHLVFIDTTILSGERKVGIRGSTVLKKFPKKVVQKHWDWIETTLKESTAEWILVFGHHPVYNNGKFGDTSYLVEKLHPLLLKYGVATYFSAHDHTQQYLRPAGETTDYIITGTGSRCEFIEPGGSENSEIEASFVWPQRATGDKGKCASHGGFTIVNVFQKSLGFEMFDDNEQTINYGTRKNPRAKKFKEGNGIWGRPIN